MECDLGRKTVNIFIKQKCHSFQNYEIRCNIVIMCNNQKNSVLCDLLSQFKTIYPINEYSGFYLPSIGL